MVHLSLGSSKEEGSSKSTPVVPKLPSTGRLKSTRVVVSSKSAITPHSMPSARSYGSLGSAREDKDCEGSVFKKYTYKFVDPALEAEYDHDILVRLIHQHRITLFCTFLVVLMIWLLEFRLLQYPGGEQLMHIYSRWDLTTAIWLAIGNIVLCFKRTHPYAQYILCFFFVTGPGFMWATGPLMYIQYYGYDYYGGVLVLFCLTLGACSRVKIQYSAITCAIILVYYYAALAGFSHKQLLWYQIFVAPFGLLGGIIISLYPGLFIEKLNRRSFLNTHILQLEDQKLNLSKKRDDALLHNIFPVELSEKLKTLSVQAKEAARARGEMSSPRLLICEAYPCVTVMMADIVGFTSLSSRVSAKEIVDILNYIFSIFDVIASEANVEKVRTLGDAFLAVCNMSIPVTQHQERMLEVAQKLLDCLPHIRKKFPTEPPLSLRIGIGSGPVLAGIMGTTKWNYDIMGETVNEAFILEAASSPGRITVSSSVLKALPKGKYPYEPVASMPTDMKGKELPAFSIVYDFEHNEDLSMPINSLNTINPGKEASYHNLLGLKMDSYAKKKKDGNTIHKDIVIEHLQIDDAFKGLFSSEYYLNEVGKMMKNRINKSKQLQFTDLADTNEAFTYRQNLLQAETSFFKKRKLWMRFRSKDLEKEYRSDIAQRTQMYTSNLSLCFFTLEVLWTISDAVFTDMPSYMLPKELWVCHLAVMAAAGILAVFARTRYFLHPTLSALVTGFLLAVMGLIACMSTHYDPFNLGHLYRPFIAFFFVFLNIRMSQYFVVILALAVCGLGFAIGALAFGPENVVNGLAGYVVFYTLACASYVILEKGLRRDFLLSRTLENRMDQTQITTWRAKLLLYNILPRSIAKRLHESQTIVDYFASGTICFAYLNVGKLIFHPMELFSVLNDLFTIFDELAKETGCEKIKTINTTYMFVSGVPTVRSDHCAVAVSQVLKMFNAVRNYKCSHIDRETGRPYPISLRAGLACGPVVAGVIGKTKYAYDIWSDSTNTASRMESTGMEGHVQVTEDVYKACQPNYSFVERGTVAVKGKGDMKTFVLKCQ